MTHVFNAAFDAYASSNPRVAEWGRLMKTLQEPPAEARSGEWWALMEPVFHMDQEPANEPLVEPARPS